MAQDRHNPARIYSGIPEPRRSRVSQVMKVEIFKSCFSTRRTKPGLDIGSRFLQFDDSQTRIPCHRIHSGAQAIAPSQSGSLECFDCALILFARDANS